MLEPVVDVTVSAPQNSLGAVPGDLAARRGQITNTTDRTVTATVPVAELFGYATAFRSRTHGRGLFTGRPAGCRPAS